MLIDCWAQLSQDVLTRAIDTAAKRLMMVIKVMVREESVCILYSVKKPEMHKHTVQPSLPDILFCGQVYEIQPLFCG